MDLTAFLRCLPPSFAPLRALAQSLQVGLLIVGGAVRDFLLRGPGYFLADLDIEVYCSGIDAYQQFIAATSVHLQAPAHALKFEIYRWQIGEVCLEVSLPRLEIYQTELRAFTHDQFQAHFVYGPGPLPASFARRDFTINSLGVYFGVDQSVPQFIDLVGGWEHLQQRLLSTVNHDFVKDPLRFLRLARMQTAYPDFSVDPALQGQLGAFNLEKLNPHYYLWAEALKAANTDFFRQFFGPVDQHHVNLPASYLPFRHLTVLPTAHPTCLSDLYGWAHYYLTPESWAEFSWPNPRASIIARRFFQLLGQKGSWLSSLQALAAQGHWDGFYQHPDLDVLQQIWQSWQTIERPATFLPPKQQGIYQYLAQLKAVKLRPAGAFPTALALEQRASYRLFQLLACNPWEE